VSTISRTDFPLDSTTEQVYGVLCETYGEYAVRGVLLNMAILSQRHRWLVPNLLYHIQYGKLKEDA
jgi:hypothetical protein